MTEVNRIKCPKCGTTSVIYYGNDLYGCCNLECEYKWKFTDCKICKYRELCEKHPQNPCLIEDEEEDD